MLPAYKGRINRKTFILGSIIGLAILGLAGVIYIVPVALIDIIINVTGSDFVFKILYTLFIIPAIFFFFYFSVLFVKRLHDVGLPGMLILGTLILLEVMARVTDIWLLKITGVLIVVAVALLPGQKARNNFGPNPAKKFKLDNLQIKF